MCALLLARDSLEVGTCGDALDANLCSMANNLVNFHSN